MIQAFGIVVAFGLLAILIELAPASLDEIKLAAATAEGFQVFQVPTAPGDPRAIFRITGISSRGIYHCTYAMMMFSTPDGCVVSEEIAANIGFFKTQTFRGDFLNDRLMRWGRHKGYKNLPLQHDEEVMLLLKNILVMTRIVISRSPAAIAVIIPS